LTHIDPFVIGMGATAYCPKTIQRRNSSRSREVSIRSPAYRDTL
jgi:hypothetical protein